MRSSDVMKKESEKNSDLKYYQIPQGISTDLNKRQLKAIEMLVIKLVINKNNKII